MSRGFKELKASDLKVGHEYAIDGKIYIFDNFSTFWNLRMIEKQTGKLHIFLRGKTVISKP